MEDTKCNATTQITLEDDIIVSDHNPDVSKIIYEKGTIKIEDMKPGADCLQLKGSVSFEILYLAEDENCKVSTVKGELSFEESIHMEGIGVGDHVQLHKELETLTVGMINPRKLSVQALLSFAASVDDVVDVESGVEIISNDDVICKYQSVEVAEILMQKKDVFRIKSECELPKNYPNIFHVLWDQITIGEVEFRPLEDQVMVQGELKLFVLYEAEGEDQSIRFYETAMPYHGSIGCSGCKEHMILDVDYQLDHGEIEIKPDFDGEERVLNVDVALDLLIKLYEESTIEILEDAYAVQKEIVPCKESATMKRLLLHNTGRCKVVEKVRMPVGAPMMMQLCHGDGEVQLEDIVVIPGGIELTGYVKMKVLYVTDEDARPYHTIQQQVPFAYQLEAPNIGPKSNMKVKGMVEQLQLTMVDGDEIQVKVILCFHAIVFEEQECEVVVDVEEAHLDQKKLQALPSMVVYVAKEGDTLWDVGKEYYAPVGSLRQINNISGEIKPGDKLLVVKSMSAFS